MIDLVQDDITRLQVDAIVNAANPELAGGGGVDGAIHRAAGPELVKASMALAPCPPGNAVLTPGFGLPADFVIHAVGPIWRGGNDDEAQVLRRTYERAFEVAAEQPQIRTIAFPAISTGVYGFPKEEATSIAVGVMRSWEARFERIVACTFDRHTFDLYRRELDRA